MADGLARNVKRELFCFVAWNGNNPGVAIGQLPSFLVQMSQQRVCLTAGLDAGFVEKKYTWDGDTLDEEIGMKESELILSLSGPGNVVKL